MDKQTEIIQRLRNELAEKNEQVDKLTFAIKEKDEEIYTLNKLIETLKETAETAKRNAVILFSQYKNVAE